MCWHCTHSLILHTQRWAALPGPLILSADLRPNAGCGGIDSVALQTLTNPEVIAVRVITPVGRPIGFVSYSVFARTGQPRRRGTTDAANFSSSWAGGVA